MRISLTRAFFFPIKKYPPLNKVAEDWLEYKKPNIRLSTWRKYEGYLRKHFNDILDFKVNRITTATVEKYITIRQNRCMNISTLRKLIVTFNQIMKYAVRHSYISYNPVRDAERPKDNGEITPDHVRILTPEQINSLLAVTTTAVYSTLFRLAIFSGARQGELFGLKWTDIDWFNSQVQIKRTFNEGAWQKPKSKASYRKIDIGPATMAVMKKWHLACPTSELDLIFPNEAGGPLDHGNMTRRHFYPALKKAELPHIRFHDLRHTYASLLFEQGENIKYIQTQLGHASPVVTLKIYAHLINPVNQDAACRLENTIFSTSGSKMVAETKQGATT